MVSVGVAVGPDHGRDASTVLRSADVALSVAKRRRGTAVYEAERDPFDLRRPYPKVTADQFVQTRRNFERIPPRDLIRSIPQSLSALELKDAEDFTIVVDSPVR